MTHLKIFITFITLTLATLQLNAQWFYGGGVKYNTNNEFKAIALNAKIGKDISDSFDLDLDFAYYLSSNAKWAIDANLHYRLLQIGEVFRLSPLAGINFIQTDKFYNSLLFGISMKVIDVKYTYYLEPKWILNEDQLSISIGVLF